VDSSSFRRVGGLFLNVGNGIAARWALDPNVANYVVCTVAGDPLTYQDAASVLDDPTLRRLCRLGTVELALPDGRTAVMKGVSRQYFDSGNQDLPVDVRPPAVLQVWELAQGCGQDVLYVPQTAGPECRVVPSRYRYAFKAGDPARRRPDERLSTLTVTLLDGLDAYPDGALRYRVGTGGYLPVPVSRRMLGVPIPLMLDNPNVEVSVEPKPECAEFYKCLQR
jgi:hypothetical protein